MKRLHRRSFLKGLGAAIALPTLEAMLNSHGTAHADGTPLPTRLVLFGFGNGNIPSRWVPTEVGPGWELSEQLTPFAALKPYVSVMSGYNLPLPYGVPHHTGAAAILSGRPYITLPANNADFSSKLAGPSFDQIAAAAIGTTVFPSLQLAVSKRASVDEGPTLRYLSHKGPDEPLPPQTNPAALFRRLFASFAPTDPADPRDSLRINVLDLVRDDLRTLRPRLGVADARRIDAHLTGISELRQQILALPPAASAACAAPAPVTLSNTDLNGVESLGPVSQVMTDLLALAFACDLTRVASYQFNGPVARTIFSDLGQTELLHVLSHTPTEAAQQQVHEAIVFSMTHAMGLLTRLHETPDGAETLLDNSCVVVTSETALGYSHAQEDHPILIAGRARGRLVHPGIHHRSDGKSTSNVILSVLQAVGVGATSFGGDGYESSTPAGEVLT